MKKEAQDPSSIITGMFQQMYDPNDKTGSLSKFIGPAIVTKVMQAMGFGFYGTLVGILLSAFDIDIAGILKNIVSSLAPQIQSGKTDFSQQEVEEKVESAFDTGFGSSKSASLSFEEILIIKTAAEKNKGILSGLSEGISKFFETDEFKKYYGSSVSNGSKNVLIRAFSRIFGILFMSMGLMAAGQGAKKLMGKPNVFDGTAEKHDNKESTKSIKYKIKDSVSTSNKTKWLVPIKNNPKEVSKFIINCVRSSFEVENLSDNEISRSAIFNDIKDDILLYNNRLESDKLIMIPSEYKNELTIAYPIIKDLS